MEFRKKGALLVPSKPYNIKVECRIGSPMYTKNAKKYLDLTLESSLEKVRDVHTLSSQYFKPTSKIIDPLVQSTLTVKVPWKYDRVACSVLGLKTIQEMVTDDRVSATIEFCGIWDVNNFCGPSWKLVNISS
jgi:hypothetical protein